jgi:hypothetical protein
VTAHGRETAGSFLTEDRPLGEEGRKSLQAHIAGLPVPRKVELGVQGNREVRSILSRDASSMVARAVLNSPKLSEEDVLSYASSSQTNEEILRGIAENRQWTANRQIVTALVNNPRTPPPAAIRFLRAFSSNELRLLVMNRGISAFVRAEARRLLAQRP